MASQFDRHVNLMFPRVLNHFGEEAEIIYRVGPAHEPSQKVSGIFTHASQLLGDEMSVSDFVSTFEMMSGYFRSPTKGDGLKVRGETYKVAEVQRDSASVIKLYLKKEKRLKVVKKK